VILRTKGKPLKASLKECKLAAKFAANILLSTRMRENLSIRVVFTEKDTKTNGWYGYCDWRDNNLRPRDFIIAIDPNLTRTQTLRVIMHEFVHVQQFATGRLKDYVRMHKVVNWMGEYHNDHKGENMTSPWEREARRLERSLYKQFKEMTR
jgi:hypothetical protein